MVVSTFSEISVVTIFVLLPDYYRFERMIALWRSPRNPISRIVPRQTSIPCHQVCVEDCWCIFCYLFPRVDRYTIPTLLSHKQNYCCSRWVLLEHIAVHFFEPPPQYPFRVRWTVHLVPLKRGLISLSWRHNPKERPTSAIIQPSNCIYSRF